MSSNGLSNLADMAKPRVAPPLDDRFRPAVLANRAFREAVRASGRSVPLVIGIERDNGCMSVYKTQVFDPKADQSSLNLPYAERIVKMLLWQKGGWRVIVGGPSEIGQHIKETYSMDGPRAFDVDFMGPTVYEKPFTVEITDPASVPAPNELAVSLGRHLDGCRIGFDLGASDRKAAAVVNGETVFSEEVEWNPRGESDPRYHYDEIMEGLRKVASKISRVDAIGGSSAGVIIDNRPMVASLFRGVPKNLFDTKVKSLFLDMKKEWGIPFEVVNDGEVTALAGAMSLSDTQVLGIAMGSSEAGGYVNEDGNITGWLNELAFAPIDYHPAAPVDEWSGDGGCGVQYLSQQGVFRLAPVAGVEMDDSLSLAEKLKSVQDLLEAGDARAGRLWETIGCYVGYAIAHYADFYSIKHMLILGRVTSGQGGNIVLDKAREVLRAEFPELAGRIALHLPDESTRRVGQAVAAASLAAIE